MVMSLTGGLWAFGGRMRGPFFPLFVLALGGSYFDIGLIASIGSIFMIVSSLIGGYLADTVGRKKIIYLMSFLISLNTLVYFASPSWEYLILASSLNSLFVGLRGPAVSAIIADSTKVETRTKGFATNQFLRILAGSVSPYVVGLFMERYGVLRAQRLAYLCAFVTSMIATILRFIYLEETLKVPEERKSIREILSDTYDGFKTTVNVMSNKVWILIGTNILFSLGVSLGISFFVTYAVEDVIGLSKSQWGLVFSVMSLINMFSGLLFASMSDRYGRLKLILPSMLLTPIFIIGFVFCKTFTQVLLVAVSLGLLGSMMGAPFKALLFDYSPQEHRGRIHALSSMLASLPGSNIIYGNPGGLINGIGKMVGGIAYGRFNALPFFIEAVIIEISAILGVIFLRNNKPRLKEP